MDYFYKLIINFKHIKYCSTNDFDQLIKEIEDKFKPELVNNIKNWALNSNEGDVFNFGNLTIIKIKN